MPNKSDRMQTARSVLQRLVGAGKSKVLGQDEAATLGFGVEVAPSTHGHSLARLLLPKMLWKLGAASKVHPEARRTPAAPQIARTSTPAAKSAQPARASSPPPKAADHGTRREQARWEELAEEDPEREHREDEFPGAYATRMRRMDALEGVGLGHQAKAAARRAGAAAMNRRCAAIFAAAASAKLPELAAELAFGSNLSARKVVLLLEKQATTARRGRNYAPSTSGDGLQPDPNSRAAQFAQAALAAAEGCRPWSLDSPRNRPSSGERPWNADQT